MCFSLSFAQVDWVAELSWAFITLEKAVFLDGPFEWKVPGSLWFIPSSLLPFRLCCPHPYWEAHLKPCSSVMLRVLLFGGGATHRNRCLSGFPRSRSHGDQETFQSSYYLVTSDPSRCPRLALADRGPACVTRLWSHPEGCRKYRCPGGARACRLFHSPRLSRPRGCDLDLLEQGRRPDLFSLISILYCNIDGTVVFCCSASPWFS